MTALWACPAFAASVAWFCSGKNGYDFLSAETFPLSAARLCCHMTSFHGVLCNKTHHQGPRG